MAPAAGEWEQAITWRVGRTIFHALQVAIHNFCETFAFGLIKSFLFVPLLLLNGGLPSSIGGLILRVETMSRSRGSPRRKALADATAGVVGSLVSMLCFYPVDVWKTSLQAAAGQASTTDADNLQHQKSSLQKRRLYDLLSKLSSIPIADLFRGLHHKVAHTIVSSFTYFFVYSLVDTKYLAYRQRNQPSSTSETYKMSTVAKLLLTAFSAMINTAITLPFDTISSRIQAGHRSNVLPKKEENKNRCTSRREEEQQYIKQYSLNTNLPKEAFESRNTTSSDDEEKRNIQIRSILSLWNGLLPALLLCSNPAIQYTMFEKLKSALLQHRSTQKQPRSKQLTMGEAFVSGLISKFFATIITYPLIRAKVMLMVSSPDIFENDDCNDVGSNGSTDRNGGIGNANSKNETGTKKYPRSLPSLLISIFRKDGMAGLYRGCSVQLLHTILKSALMLMIRERITSVCHQFFLQDAA